MSAQDTITTEQARALLRSAETLIETGQRMNACGLNQGTAGNLSVRIAGGLLITPSSLPYERMQPRDLLAIDATGAPLPAAQRILADSGPSGPPRRPSSEWRLHADVLSERPEVDAVLHCHSIRATALACHGRGIPAFHYMVAQAGGADIRCAPYATFGTRALSRLTAEALRGRRACLLAHHGQVAVGATAGAALALAVEVETLAAMYLESLRLGEPPVLGAEEMARVLERMHAMHYGGLTED